MSIKNVVVVGAGGNLGAVVLPALLGASFSVTVLSRSNSKATFPDEVKVIKADYTSETFLSAFTGQDVVISLISVYGIAEQKPMIDAAIAAGVKRFLPSSYVPDCSSKVMLDFLPLVQGRLEIMEHLIAKQATMSWTSIDTGLIFDYTLKIGYIYVDTTNKKATLIDGGEVQFSCTHLATIARAIVAVLSDHSYEKTKNRVLKIADYTTTQKEIVAVIEKVTGEKWEVSAADSGPLVQEAKEQLAKGDFSGAMTLIQLIYVGRIALAKLDGLSNDELGLPKEYLEETVKTLLL